MYMNLSNNQKQVYLSALETIFSTTDKFGQLAHNLGMDGVNRSREASAKQLYAKISATKGVSIPMTRANLNTLLIGMRNLDYLYSVDEHDPELM